MATAAAAAFFAFICLRIASGHRPPDARIAGPFPATGAFFYFSRRLQLISMLLNSLLSAWTMNCS